MRTIQQNVGMIARANVTFVALLAANDLWLLIGPNTAANLSLVFLTLVGPALTCAFSRYFIRPENQVAILRSRDDPIIAAAMNLLVMLIVCFILKTDTPTAAIIMGLGLPFSVALILLAYGAVNGIALQCFKHLRRFSDDRHCWKCDYDLFRNTSGICPECGTPVPLPRLMIARDEGKTKPH